MIKEHFIKDGYKVMAEVKDCDIVSFKDDEIIIIEMKLKFNITLLSQAIDRMKITDKVYVAILKPKRFSSKEYHRMRTHCKLLGIGLILVDLRKNAIEIVVEPSNIHKIVKTKKKAFLKELNSINVDVNTGGTTNVKINTAYRERCIHIACILQHIEDVSAKELTQIYNFDVDPYNFLYNNHYQWFEKTTRGRYKLSNLGYLDLDDEKFSEVVRYYENLIKENHDL